MNSPFKGTGVALVTPFNPQLQVDYNALGKLIEYCIEGRVEYLVCLGTTGESVVLSADEQKKVFDYTREKIDNRLPLILGIGGNNTGQVIEKIDSTDLEGVDAILSVSPFYNKPSQEGIYEHYKALSNSTEKSIILYNVPGRTGKNMEAETTLKLARDFANIVAVKEASGDFEQCMKIIRDKPDNFTVLSGDDAFTLPLIALGMDGVISVVANAFPMEFSTMVRGALNDNYFTGRKWHYRLLEIIDLLFVDGNPPGVKAALQILGVCEQHMRLPNVPVRKSTYERLEELIGSLDREIFYIKSI